MVGTRRTAAFWFTSAFLALSIVLLLLGQTMAVVDYDLTVRLGLQESSKQVGAHGVQVNRAFGAGDTIVYIPLMVASLAGIWLRKRWALLTTAAVAGISAYWTATIGWMLAFLPGTPGYNYAPRLGYGSSLEPTCCSGFGACSTYWRAVKNSFNSRRHQTTA